MVLGYYTVSQAAKKLNLHPDTILAAIRKDLLPGFFADGGYCLDKKIINNEAKILHNPKKFLKSSEVVEKLGISINMLYKYLRLHKLKPTPCRYFNYHWSYYRFALKDVQALAEFRKVNYLKHPNKCKYPPPR